jgi:pimeloyl-ACP methyl ester carboxylesterase
VEDLLALLDELGYERVTLVGHSMGSYIGQEIAFRYPHRVKAMVAIDSTCLTLEHPRLIRPVMDLSPHADAVIDMIKATKEFLDEEGIQVNDKLFLTGYSEGGYVTLAAAKEIELNPSHALTVTAVAAGAGSYDLENMFEHITTTTEYSDPSYLAFLIMAYNTTNDWNKPLSFFLKKPTRKLFHFIWTEPTMEVL